MGLEKYVDKEQALVVLEKVAETVAIDVLKPALDKVVADSSNPFDDAALNVAWPMILKALDKIDGDDAA
jgi:hypothetical protein